MILAWLMALLCLNIVLGMFIFVYDLYIFGIFAIPDTLIYLHLFSHVQRQFIFSLLSVYYPYLKPWAGCINFMTVYFGIFSGYFRYMILHLYVLFFFLVISQKFKFLVVLNFFINCNFFYSLFIFINWFY